MYLSSKDHLNWHLIGEAAKKAKGNVAEVLKAAHEEVEDEEDEHLYHTTGWARELWIESLGMKAVLPLPEEVKEVKTAIGAARAAQVGPICFSPKNVRFENVERAGPCNDPVLLFAFCSASS